MKKISFFALLFSVISFACFAQVDEPTTNGSSLLSNTQPTQPHYDINDKVMLGGNLSLSFGSMTMVEVSPLIGYNIKPGFTVGATFTYMYFSYSSDAYSYNAQNFGAGLFAKVKVYKDFYLQLEPEWLNFKYLDNRLDSQRKWAFNALVGVTFRSRLGERFAVDYSILWNVNQTANSPYDNPIVRVAFVY